MKKSQLKQTYLFSICGEPTGISIRSDNQWYHNTPENGET